MSQELTRLRAEVEKREQRDLERAEKYLKEHAELRAEIEALKKERSDIAAIASHQESTLAALRVLCAAKDEALKQIANYVDPNSPVHATATCALRLTPATCAGTLVDAAELAELRRTVAAFVKRDTEITGKLGHAEALLGWAEDNLIRCVQYSEPEVDGSLYRLEYYTRGHPQQDVIQGKTLLECMEKAMTITAQNLLRLDAARDGKAVT